MYVKVRVSAGAKKEVLICENNDTFKVSVKEKTERNAANRRVRELLAEYFSVLPSTVRIIKGHTSSSKIMLISKGDI